MQECGGGTIYVDEELSDFSVRFEYKLPPGGNNGLAIRYPGSGDTAYVGMCELQVLDDTAKKYSKLHPAQYHGSAYGMAAAVRGYQRNVGDWNQNRYFLRITYYRRHRRTEKTLASKNCFWRNIANCRLH